LKCLDNRAILRFEKLFIPKKLFNDEYLTKSVRPKINQGHIMKQALKLDVIVTNIGSYCGHHLFVFLNLSVEEESLSNRGQEQTNLEVKDLP
jgi:hypothetical protein